jgi:translation initiation factor 2 subunit 2
MVESGEMINNYKKMLSIAYSEIPRNATKHERFEVPRMKHDVVGRRGPTIIQNFREICDILNRDPAVVLKFLARELGTPGNMIGQGVTFKGRFDYQALKGLLDRYVAEFVTCPVCNSPDTKITKEKRLRFLKCDACGAKSPVRAK